MTPLDISRTHLALYIGITILLTVFPMLNFTSPCLLCNYQSVLLNSFNFFTLFPSCSPLWQTSVCSLYLWVSFFLFVCLCYSLDFKYKWNQIVFDFLSLTYFTYYPLVLSMLLQIVRFNYFYCQLIFCYMYIQFHLYLIIYW